MEDLSNTHYSDNQVINIDERNLEQEVRSPIESSYKNHWPNYEYKLKRHYEFKYE